LTFFVIRFDENENSELHILAGAPEIIKFQYSAMLDLTGSEQQVGGSPSFEGGIASVEDFDAPLVDVCGYLLPISHKEGGITNVAQLSGKEHQHTSTSLANLSSLALAVCKGDPILLAGPTGAGKTHTIHYLAQLTNNKGTKLA